jgi:hypothetical protein
LIENAFGLSQFFETVTLPRSKTTAYFQAPVRELALGEIKTNTVNEAQTCDFSFNR